MALIIVDTNSDVIDLLDGVTSLREALIIAQSTSGVVDEITFDSTVSIITLDSGLGALVISGNQELVIAGDHDGDGVADVAIDGGDATRLFTVEAGAVTTLAGLTLVNGNDSNLFNGQAASGANGINGPNGIDGDASVLPQANGTDGGEANSGGTGFDSVDETSYSAGAILNHGDLTLLGVSLINNTGIGRKADGGGDGGTGGTGGTGGIGDGYYFGSAGQDGHNGGPGGWGGIGGNGGDGADAAGAIVNTATGILTLSDTAFTHNLGIAGGGGNGGTGGVGGAGGQGRNGGSGTAYLANLIDGGDGGDGGTGGVGGNGGNSGNGGIGVGGLLNFGSLIELTSSAADGSNVGFGGGSGSAGFAGTGGVGGSAGSGGPGYDNYFGSYSVTADGADGADGVAGAAGAVGNIGTAGAGSDDFFNAGSGSGILTTFDTLIFAHGSDIDLVEGTGGTTTFTFHVNRVGYTNEAISTDWTLVAGAGTGVTDFVGGVLPSGTVNFAVGEMSKVVTFDVVADAIVEGDDFFTIELSNLTNGTGGSTSGYGTSVVAGKISNDDGVNLHPTALALSNNSIDENASTGTVVGTFLPTDVDDTTGFSYELVDDTSGFFDVSGNQLVVRPGALLDFEADNGHEITARVIDASGNSFTQTLAIDVNDVQGTTIAGTGGADVLAGGRENDTVNGFAGDDSLYGWFGNDTLNGGDGVDRLRGKDGNDVLLGGDGRDDLRGGNDGDFLYGGNDKDWMHGENGDDVLRGNAGNDKLRGGNGNDDLRGGDGYDFIFGGTGADWMSGGAQNDRLFGQDGDDVLYGDDGHDRLSGNDGDDRLFGGAGNDLLRGGNGNDLLTSGTGFDSFDFADNWGNDWITDFELGKDKINMIAVSSVSDFAGLVFSISVDGHARVHAGTDVITLAGVDVGDLSAGDFII